MILPISHQQDETSSNNSTPLSPFSYRSQSIQQRCSSLEKTKNSEFFIQKNYNFFSKNKPQMTPDNQSLEINEKNIYNNQLNQCKQIFDSNNNNFMSIIDNDRVPNQPNSPSILETSKNSQILINKVPPTRSKSLQPNQIQPVTNKLNPDMFSLKNIVTMKTPSQRNTSYNQTTSRNSNTCNSSINNNLVSHATIQTQPQIQQINQVQQIDQNYARYVSMPSPRPTQLMSRSNSNQITPKLNPIAAKIWNDPQFIEGRRTMVSQPINQYTQQMSQYSQNFQKPNLQSHYSYQQDKQDNIVKLVENVNQINNKSETQAYTVVNTYRSVGKISEKQQQQDENETYISKEVQEIIEKFRPICEKFKQNNTDFSEEKQDISPIKKEKSFKFVKNAVSICEYVPYTAESKVIEKFEVFKENQNSEQKQQNQQNSERKNLNNMSVLDRISLYANEYKKKYNIIEPTITYQNDDSVLKDINQNQCYSANKQEIQSIEKQKDQSNKKRDTNKENQVDQEEEVIKRRGNKFRDNKRSLDKGNCSQNFKTSKNASRKQSIDKENLMIDELQSYKTSRYQSKLQSRKNSKELNNKNEILPLQLSNLQAQNNQQKIEKEFCYAQRQLEYESQPPSTYRNEFLSVEKTPQQNPLFYKDNSSKNLPLTQELEFPQMTNFDQRHSPNTSQKKLWKDIIQQESNPTSIKKQTIQSSENTMFINNSKDNMDNEQNSNKLDLNEFFKKLQNQQTNSILLEQQQNQFEKSYAKENLCINTSNSLLFYSPDTKLQQKKAKTTKNIQTKLSNKKYAKIQPPLQEQQFEEIAQQCEEIKPKKFSASKQQESLKRLYYNRVEKMKQQQIQSKSVKPQEQDQSKLKKSTQNNANKNKPQKQQKQQNQVSNKSLQKKKISSKETPKIQQNPQQPQFKRKNQNQEMDHFFNNYNDELMKIIQTQ